MGEVVAFKKVRKVRKTSLRGEARALLTECLDAVHKPQGVVVFVIGKKGSMSLRFSCDPDVMPMDVLARAETMAHAEKLELLRPQDDEDEEMADE